MQLPSSLLEEAVEAFATLPGIGRKTALRLVLHLLRRDPAESGRLGEAIVRMRREIKFCRVCRNASDTETCSICANPARSTGTVCVVENVRDLLAIEQTGQYAGRYHVLGGIISPMDGIGPEQIEVESLVARAESGEIDEALMAISPTIEGDTTIYYLHNRLEPHGVRVTTLARGISFGGDLEYVDEITLARSIATRTAWRGEAGGSNDADG